MAQTHKIRLYCQALWHKLALRLRQTQLYQRSSKDSVHSLGLRHSG